MRTACSLPSALRRTLGGALLVLAAGPLRGQGQLTLRGPDPAVVRPGGTTRITLFAAGADADAQLRPVGDLDGLRVEVGEPLLDDFQTILDGEVRRVRGRRWEVALRPEREGRFELPPIEAVVDGRVLASRSVRFECVRDLSGEPYAFVETRAARAAWFVGERFEVVVRIGVEREFLRTNVVQLSARELDVPVRLALPWIDGLSRALVLEPRESSAAKLVGEELLTFALNGELARAPRVLDETRDGRAFLVLELQRELVATRSGALRVPAPSLSFAFATQFEGGAFAASGTADWQLAHVDGEPLDLSIEALPDDGRPLDYGGAVGRFAIEAELADPSVASARASSIRVRVTISGEGDLSRFDPPELVGAGFDLLGVLDDRDARPRTVTYDLAPGQQTPRAVPSFVLHAFDPVERRYRTLQSEPIPLRWGASASEPDVARTRAPAVVPQSELGRADAREGAPRAQPGSFSLRWVVGGGVLLAVLVQIVRARRRSSHGAKPLDPARQERALGALRAALDGGAVGEDALDPFAELLAARAACEPAALLGFDARERLIAAGLPPELAQRSADVLHELVHARYGEAARTVSANELRELIDELAQHS